MLELSNRRTSVTAILGNKPPHKSLPTPPPPERKYALIQLPAGKDKSDGVGPTIDNLLTPFGGLTYDTCAKARKHGGLLRGDLWVCPEITYPIALTHFRGVMV